MGELITKHRSIDIERAVEAINEERALEYQEQIKAKIAEIMADSREIWLYFDDNSLSALHDFMLCSLEEDTSEAWEDFYNAAIKLRSAVHCDIARAAALDVAVPLEASREDAVDYLEMRGSDDE